MNKRYAVGLAVFMCGAIFGVAGSRLLSAESQAGLPSTKMILRTDLPNIPGQEVLVFTTDWAPGTALPMHIHPDGNEVTYVVEGEQTFHFQGGGVKIVKAGEALYTPPNTPHFGQNATDKPAKTVVFRIKDKTQPISINVTKQP